jgi:hypothetical protein
MLTKSTLLYTSLIIMLVNKNILNIPLDMQNKQITAMYHHLQIFMQQIKEKFNIFLIKLKILFLYQIDHYLMESMENILELALMILKIYSPLKKLNLVLVEVTGQILF